MHCNEWHKMMPFLLKNEGKIEKEIGLLFFYCDFPIKFENKREMFYVWLDGISWISFAS